MPVPSVGREVGTIRQFYQAPSINDCDHLPPGTDETFPFESLDRHCHKRSVHAKHDGEKPVCERHLCPEILCRLHPGSGIARNRAESAVLTPNDSGSHLGAPSQAQGAHIDVDME